MFSRLSLKYRIALIIFILEALMMSVVLWKTLGQSYDESAELIANNEEAILQLVSGISRASLITEEYAELQPYIKHLITTTEATRLYLADSDRTIVASSITTDLGQSIFDLDDREHHQWEIREINNASGILGILAIEFSDTKLTSSYTETRDLGITIALAGMFIIASVGILVGFFLTRRLEVITQTAKRLSEGDFSARTKIKAQDELGALARTFDDMTDSLQQNKISLHQSLAAIKQSEQDLMITLNSIGDAVIATNKNGEITRMNPVAELLTGWTLREAQGQPFKRVFPIIDASTRVPLENPIDKVISTGEIIYLSNHTTLIDRQGKEFQITDSAAPIRSEDGNIQGVVLVFNDVTEQYALREKARDVQKQLQALLKEMQTMIAILSTEGRILFINETPLKVFGLSAENLDNKKIWDNSFLSQDENIQVILQDSVKQAASGISVNRDLRFETQEESIWVNISIHPVVNDQGLVKQLLLEGHDISERKSAEDKILYQAHYDELTGLPNRFLSLDRLNQLINEAERSDELIAVLFIDLDDFKKVNDTMGHETGDKLLIEAAERLKHSVRVGDTVGRLGGDEFIVLLSGIKNNAETQPIVENLLNRFRNSFMIDNRELTLTTSIGIAVFPEDGSNSSDILRNSDAAMYHAKEQGRNTYSYYTQAMNDSVARRLALEEQMHGSIERSEFEVYFQPQIEITSGKIIGTEALLRWHNHALGSISPSEFIPIAEQTGFIVFLGRFIIAEAISKTFHWQQDVNRDFRIAINLSPRQFRDSELVPYIKNTLEQWPIRGENLELEITEGVLLNGHGSIDNALSELNMIGVGIAMDDFGTGYSSLSYLRRYPFDVIKIDKSFVEDITVDRADQELISAAIAMAHSLNLKVVAEGVETEAQLDLLKKLKCDYAQGYLLGKPLPANEITKLLVNEKDSIPVK
jgi:diguanylate cyclase (GGDEF)-like protein/PAS domain S-box-containing protein